MNHRFVLLGLVLAKWWVAIYWMQLTGPEVQKWMEDMHEWGTADERRLCAVRTDDNAQSNLEIWEDMLDRTWGPP
ncbi:hypothetical protein NDU88_002615 [Pleurodeles waltl]|uniref:Uncharacterized protein n=1 Tax=Pleurodeles waltl TaxID=8319 RepID=A0AAV7LG93_PLEWA|nr:hypothetical protein NDU88_002615 [Pleurodeles waltl]